MFSRRDVLTVSAAGAGTPASSASIAMHIGMPVKSANARRMVIVQFMSGFPEPF